MKKLKIFLLNLILLCIILLCIGFLSAFKLNGTVYDINGNALNNSVINISIYRIITTNPEFIGSNSTTSNEAGWFELNITENSSWLYKPVITHANATNGHIDWVSSPLPRFLYIKFSQLSNINFYLREAGTINLTAVNATGSSYAFKYLIKDVALGYTVDEMFDSYVAQKTLYVPRDRNYSIMIYPNQSMPVNYNWNNFSAVSSYDFSDELSNYNSTTKTLNKKFNITRNYVRVSGYALNSTGGCSGYDNFTVVPFLLEPGNIVYLSNNAGTSMPYNTSAWISESDIYNKSTCFYNITLVGSPDSVNYMLFASVSNNTSYYGGFRNISLNYLSPPTEINFTLYTLMSTIWGSSDSNIIMWDVASGGSVNISSAKQRFNIINSTTNAILSDINAHFEVQVDYSNYNSTLFTFVSYISSGNASIYLPLLNVTGIREINIYSMNYAPKRIGARTPVQILNNSNVSLSEFSPGEIPGESAIADGSININIYKSNLTCDVPTPINGCNITSSSNLNSFNPLSIIIGGGAISFRMGIGGVLVHYVNVDMFASGPPDAMFEDNDDVSENTTSRFSKAIRFGSQGPKIYDYVLISIPYTEGNTTQTGLNETGQVNISIANLYDENWDLIWNNVNNGTNGTLLAGNHSHYLTYSSEWSRLLGNNTCMTNLTLFNSTNPCFINTTENRIWIRLPHFSGTNVNLMGSIIPDSTAPKIISVLADSVDSDSAVIEWATNENSNSSVKYGVSSSLGATRSSAIQGTSHSISLTGLSADTLYYYNVTSCDIIGNCNTTGIYNFTTTSAGTTSNSGGNTASTTNTTIEFWAVTYSLSDEILKSSAGCIREFSEKHRAKILVGSETHYIGVISVTSTGAVINISSTPRQATFSIGDEKTFDVTNDNYDDIYIKLNSIGNYKANLTIKSINRPSANLLSAGNAVVNTTGNESGNDKSSGSINKWFWLIGIIIVLVVIGVVVYFVLMQKDREDIRD